jgi:hypothetical protein
VYHSIHISPHADNGWTVFDVGRSDYDTGTVRPAVSAIRSTVAEITIQGNAEELIPLRDALNDAIGRALDRDDGDAPSRVQYLAETALRYLERSRIAAAREGHNWEDESRAAYRDLDDVLGWLRAVENEHGGEV